MSISRICTLCKSTFKLTTLQCPRCRVNLRKLKVRVRVGQGKWKTIVTDNLQVADEFQRAWSAVAQGEQQPPESQQKSPTPPRGASAVSPQHQQREVTLREVFDSFITWAETHKRSWKSDLNLFELRISPVLGPLPLSAINPKRLQTFIDGLKPVRKKGQLSPA